MYSLFLISDILTNLSDFAIQSKKRMELNFQGLQPIVQAVKVFKQIFNHIVNQVAYFFVKIVL